MKNWSIEATFPKPGEIANITTMVESGTEIYLSTLPHVSLDQQINAAKLVRAAGLEPVLHIAARFFLKSSDLSAYIERAVREANVNRLLLIGGDLDRPRGEFSSSHDILESGILGELGIKQIGVAGYPDGHPSIDSENLTRELDKKLTKAAAIGISAQVVTQFCFNAKPINSWIADFRQQWPETTIKIGLVGPTGVKALMKYALRCGVISPLNSIGLKMALAARFVRTVSPEKILYDIDEASNISAHFYSFGGLERTVHWVNEFAKQDGDVASMGTRC